jgi:hypothetical protein
LQQHFPADKSGSTREDVAIDNDPIQIGPSLKHPIHLPQHLRIQPPQQSFQGVFRADRYPYRKAIAFATIVPTGLDQLVTHPDLRPRIEIAPRHKDFLLGLLFDRLGP